MAVNHPDGIVKNLYIGGYSHVMGFAKRNVFFVNDGEPAVCGNAKVMSVGQLNAVRDVAVLETLALYQRIVDGEIVAFGVKIFLKTGNFRFYLPEVFEIFVSRFFIMAPVVKVEHFHVVRQNGKALLRLGWCILG